MAIVLMVNGQQTASLKLQQGQSVELRASGMTQTGELVEFLVWPASANIGTQSVYEAAVWAQGQADEYGIAAAVVTFPSPGSYNLAAYATGEQQGSNIIPVSVSSYLLYVPWIALGLSVVALAGAVVAAKRA